MRLSYPAILTPFENGTGGYTVEFPDIEGAFTEGHDLTDALYMAQDVASICVLDKLEKGECAPPASNITDIRPQTPDSIVTLILIDPDEYAKRYGDRLAKVEAELPIWLITWADRHGIDYSDVLRTGLEAKLENESE